MKQAPMYGNGLFRIIKNYYLPSIWPLLITMMSYDISTIIIEIAGLSFIGLGAQEPSAEWGVMINEGRAYIQEAPWLVIFPCLMLIVSILLFTRFGDAMSKKFLIN